MNKYNLLKYYSIKIKSCNLIDILINNKNKIKQRIIYYYYNYEYNEKLKNKVLIDYIKII